MTVRQSSQRLFVDHVLGWAARLGDADAAGACRPATDGQTRPQNAQSEQKAIAGDEGEDRRPRGRRFPYGGQ
jgi:hypothetical protein